MFKENMVKEQSLGTFVRRSLLAGCGLLMAATLAAQTAPAPPATTPSAPASPSAEAPAPAPEPQDTPRSARPPRPPRPPRASTRVMVGNGYGSGMGFGSGSFLGVDIVDVSSDRVSALKLPDESGVEITAVDQDGPAGKAQLKEHDVIRTFNGQRVEGAEQMRRFIRETPPGRTVELGVFRDGKPLAVKVQLADRQTLVKTITIPDIRVEPPVINFEPFAFETLRSLRSGMQLESLTPQLREFFGVPAGQGLLVRAVERGSNAEAAGIKAGDVIVKVQNQPVHSMADLQMAMRGATGTVAVTVVREKREQTVTLKLPEKQSGALVIEYPGEALTELTDAATLLQNSEELRAFAEQQKAWSKQFKDSQRQWQKQLEQQMKELRKQQKLEED